MDVRGVREVTMDTRRSTGSRGVQGQGGSAGGARSGRGNDGSGGRRRGWRREGGEVGDAADGSFTTPFNILREGGVGPAGRGSMQVGVLGHGMISPGPSAQEGARKSEEDGKRKREGSWGGMDGGGVREVTMDTRCSTGSRGVQGQGGSAGAAGGVTAGARSGRGNDGSGGRRAAGGGRAVKSEMQRTALPRHLLIFQERGGSGRQGEGR